MLQDFSGRVALITGAGKGLGRAYAHWLGARGCSVVVNNRAHPGVPSSAASVAEEIRAMGGRASVDEHGVDDEAGARAMVAHALAEFGRLDILVCNAGVSHIVPFKDLQPEDLRRLVDTNIWGTIHPVHAAWPHMLAAGYGRLVLTGSAVSFYGAPGFGAYGATKSVVLGLARSLAQEIPADADIRVNVVLPLAHTPMSARTIGGGSDDLKPEMVAPVVGWLASEACAESGMILHVGAGSVTRVRTLESHRARAEEAGDDAWLNTLNATIDVAEPANARAASAKIKAPWPPRD
jgi:NAD(P)-dependent dehydrogenase (short-subunit alcohol dehydrogenase family)